MSPTECGPARHDSGETTCTTESATCEGNNSYVNSTLLVSTVDPCSASARAACARYYLEPLIAQARAVRPLPEVGTPEWVVADPMTKYAATFVTVVRYLDATAMSSMVGARNRRVSAEERREFLTAQREASHAISAGLDWAAESRRPSHAELVKRRAVVVMPS